MKQDLYCKIKPLFYHRFNSPNLTYLPHVHFLRLNNSMASKSAVCKEYGDKLEIQLQKPLDSSTSLALDEVLIESKTSAMTFTDLLMCRGKYQIKPDVPFIAGREVAGKVLGVGENVKHLKIGDKVYAFLPKGGGFADHVKTLQNNCFVLPSNMDYKIANSMYSSYVTAYLGLIHKARLTSHDKVLVTGAGGALGLAVIDICANVYKTKVIGVTSSSEKSETIRQRGAFATIELGDLYKETLIASPTTTQPSSKGIGTTGDNNQINEKKISKNEIESLGGHQETKSKRKNIIKEQVDYLTEKQGVDVIFETIGGNIFEDCLKSLAFDGRMIVAGFAGGSIPSVPTNRLLLNNVTLIGFTQTNYYDHRVTSNAYKEAFENITSYWEKGYIKPIIATTEFNLDQINDAIEYVKAKKAIGKIIINLNNQ